MSSRTPVLALLALVLAGCSQGEKKPRLANQAVVGLWTNDSVPAAAGGVIRYRLRIEASGMAEFITAPSSGPVLTERGTWDGADSLVRVIVRDVTAPSRASSLLFAIRGRRALGLVNADTSTFGASGLTLTRAASSDSAR